MADRWPDWPEELRPDRAPIYTCNELEIEAPAEVVWGHLVRAVRWPEFYANARDVRIEAAATAGPAGSPAADLEPGVLFHWRTFGLMVKTRVVVFDPHRALAWRGDELYGRGQHTWLLVPTGHGCRVITEEVQAGLVPWLGQLFLRPGLLRWHQRWLEGLASRAATGPVV